MSAQALFSDTWHRASINLDIEEWTEDEIEEATTATCPTCAVVIDLDTLVIEDGQWVVG